jgi:hypothetical protein
MSAPVKKCEACDDTGSKSRDLGGYLDCFACDIADQRVKFRNVWGSATDALAWRAYQLGMAAASAQPDADMLRDVLAIQDACGLHTDEYAPGSVIEYIKDLEADTDAADPVAPVAAQPVIQTQEMTDQRIFEWAEGYVFSLKGMPHKMTFSRPRFIQAVRAIIANLPASPSLEAQPAGEVERDAVRYRYLRDRANETMPQWPKDKSCWVVQYHHPQGTIPELKSAGMGDELDRTIDSAIAMAQGEKNV